MWPSLSCTCAAVSYHTPPPPVRSPRPRVSLANLTPSTSLSVELSPSLRTTRTTCTTKLDKLIFRTMLIVVSAVFQALVSYLVYDHCECVRSFVKYEPDIEATLSLPECANRNNGTGVAEDATCTALWVSYIWAAVQLCTFIGFNVALFCRDSIRYHRRDINKRPPDVTATKTFVPHCDMAKINIWAESAPRKYVQYSPFPGSNPSGGRASSVHDEKKRGGVMASFLSNKSNKSKYHLGAEPKSDQDLTAAVELGLAPSKSPRKSNKQKRDEKLENQRHAYQY